MAGVLHGSACASSSSVQNDNAAVTIVPLAFVPPLAVAISRCLPTSRVACDTGRSGDLACMEPLAVLGRTNGTGASADVFQAKIDSGCAGDISRWSGAGAGHESTKGYSGHGRPR